MADGKITIFSGEGRGKSSAAFGRALARASSGERTVIIQFLKGNGMYESEFVKRLEPEIKLFRFERGKRDYKDRSEQERMEEAENIRNGLLFARKVLSTGQCDLLILDEVLEVISNNIISVDQLREICRDHRGVDVIMTGTTLDPEICTFADEILEIRFVPFKAF